MLGFGDRHAERVTVRRNLAGFIEGILDGQGREVITLEVDELGRPQRAVDYTGREILYTWSNDELTAVQDVRGQTWRYGYELLGDTRVLASRTDPRGNRTEFVHERSAAGTQCLQPA